jgi:hypothetical protein
MQTNSSLVTLEAKDFRVPCLGKISWQAKGKNSKQKAAHILIHRQRGC